jgi:hypothetical protein
MAPGCRRKGRLMNTSVMPHPQETPCELRFQSLFDAGRAYAFPCDAAGHVDMDALSDRSRANYLYARTVIGREFAHPAVTTCAEH